MFDAFHCVVFGVFLFVYLNVCLFVRLFVICLFVLKLGQNKQSLSVA